jgi:hypothetical protein
MASSCGLIELMLLFQGAQKRPATLAFMMATVDPTLSAPALDQSYPELTRPVDVVLLNVLSAID